MHTDARSRPLTDDRACFALKSINISISEITPKFSKRIKMVISIEN